MLADQHLQCLYQIDFRWIWRDRQIRPTEQKIKVVFIIKIDAVDFIVLHWKEVPFIAWRGVDKQGAPIGIVITVSRETIIHDPTTSILITSVTDIDIVAITVAKNRPTILIIHYRGFAGIGLHKLLNDGKIILEGEDKRFVVVPLLFLVDAIEGVHRFTPRSDCIASKYIIVCILNKYQRWLYIIAMLVEWLGREAMFGRSVEEFHLVITDPIAQIVIIVGKNMRYFENVIHLLIYEKKRVFFRN